MSMQINENLLKNFVKAMNVQKDKETRLYYGTIVDVTTINDERIAYVHLDGSEPDMRTPVVEGTEVMKDDRVVVTIENHKAVVISNITSPASARTAKNYMDLVEGETEEESGLKIGYLDSDINQYNVLITPVGMYFRNGDNVLAKYASDGTTLYDENGEEVASFKESGIELNLGYSEGLSHTAFLKGGALDLYQNWQGYDNYDAMTRIQPGYFEMENNAGERVSMSSGSVTAEYGCNAKVVHISVSSASTISVNHGAAYSGSIQAVVPIGYTPCGIVKRQILGQPYYFTYLEVDNTGNISYTIYNASSSDGTGISVHFTIACAFTG